MLDECFKGSLYFGGARVERNRDVGAEWFQI